MKTTMICETDKEGTVIKMESTDCYLSGLLEDIEDFLRGCGFQFDGHLDFVVDEDDDSNNRSSEPRVVWLGKIY